ncbi:MAG: HRDC domain-containing protein [Anaerolineae bacterium]|jgi:ribonuclease D|nr:HRDC domain-containing protein [Anaerolineae bacterium]
MTFEGSKTARRTATGAAAALPPPVLVDSPASFDHMIEALVAQPALALDTESNSLYRYHYRVCVVQISTTDTDYLLDPLRLRDIAPLGAILADPQIQKVFHAAENDILMLKRDFDFSFANVFDTMLAARILGWRQVSLAALLLQHFGVELDKHTQLTDWSQRPLTPAQLSYARLDSRYLLPLRDRLTEALKEKKRWREAQDAFEGLPKVQYVEKPFDPDGFWRMKGARDLSPREMAVLRELWLWRDDQARLLDRPPFKVLGDDTLVLIARSQPEHPFELPISPRQIDHHGVGLLQAVARGMAAPPPAPPARVHNGNGRPDPQVQARFDRLRAWRAQRAAEREVDADIVMNNDALMTIARAAPNSIDALTNLGVLGAWKLQEYGAELLRVLGAL